MMTSTIGWRNRGVAMTSQRVFETESIDLAAYLATAGHKAIIRRNPTAKRAVFEFTESDELHKAVVNYERGEPNREGRAMIDRIANFLYRLHRSLLSRQISERAWDRDLSGAVDCLTYLIEYLQGHSMRAEK